MKGNYNPFSKSYQILCFQEQNAHKKNLKEVKSVKQSNVKIIEKHHNNIKNSRQRSQSECSFIESQIIDPHVTIHKNRPRQKDQHQKRMQQNRRMALKLMNISCSVITRDESIRQYQNHKMYQEISRKYSRNGSKKNFLNQDLSSSMFSRKSSYISGKKTGLNSHNHSQFDPKVYSFYDEQLKPRYN